MTSVGISSSLPATPRSEATAPIASPATAPAAAWGAPARSGAPALASWPSSRTAAIATSSTAITRCSLSGLRRVAQPAPSQAPSGLPREQLRDHFPTRRDGAERHRRGPERQGRGDDDEAHRLVEDDRLERREAEGPDQQRQPELHPAQADQASEGADHG